jgi:hypothetical protein
MKERGSEWRRRRKGMNSELPYRIFFFLSSFYLALFIKLCDLNQEEPLSGGCKPRLAPI